MVRTPKVWTENQAHAYDGKNAIYKFLVNRKLPVPPPINKQGRGWPKKMRARKKKKLPNIYGDGYSGSGDHNEVWGRFHGHRRGRSSTEGTNRSLTDNKVDVGIKYRRNGNGRGNTQSMMTTAATPLTAPMTTGIYGGTKYHRDGRQHSDSDNFYLVSGSNDGNGNTDSGSDDETSNKYW